MMTAVLDASAVLAWLGGEAGAELVRDVVSEGAALSSVNLAEVLAKIDDRGGDVDKVHGDLRGVLEIVGFDEADAVESAAIRSATRDHNVSLGDRACLALGRTLGLSVVTADRGWDGIPRLGVQVECIR
jgi:ribonuclease VapC